MLGLEVIFELKEKYFLTFIDSNFTYNDGSLFDEDKSILSVGSNNVKWVLGIKNTVRLYLGFVLVYHWKVQQRWVKWNCAARGSQAL